jgi:transcriptional regulator with XRE-family HTH domain
MFESFEKLFKDAPKGSYGTFEVSEEILSAHPQLKALLDELPSGAWIAGSAAMAIHDRVVPPVSREIPKGSFNGDVPLKVTPNLLEYADIDIFCRDENACSLVCSALKGLDYDRTRVSMVSIHFESQESNTVPVQVISFAGFPSVERVLDVFDLETCCFALWKRHPRTLGERLAEARRESGKDLSEVSKDINVPFLTIHQAEYKQVRPNNTQLQKLSEYYNENFFEEDPPASYQMTFSYPAALLLPKRQLALRHVHTPIATLNRAIKYMQRGFLMPAQAYMRIFEICHELMQQHSEPAAFLNAAFFGWLSPIEQKPSELEVQEGIATLAASSRDLSTTANTYVALETHSFEPVRGLDDHEIENIYQGSRSVMRATEEVGGYDLEFEQGDKR